MSTVTTVRPTIRPTLLRLAGAVAATALLALPFDAAAQVGSRGPWEIGAGAIFETYSFSDEEEAGIESISLLTTPFGARADLGAGFDLSVEGAWAYGSVSRPGREDLDLSGLTDTRVRLGWGLDDGAFRIELIGNAPTGNESHDEEEAIVAGAVSADLLPFRISHWGTGAGLTTNVSAARSWGSFGAGVSVSYRLTDEFDPVEGDPFTYQPGDEFGVQVATDFTIDESSRLSLSVGVRTYQEDQTNQDRNLFQTGDRVEAVATYSFPVALRSAAALYGGFIHREEGSFLVPPNDEVPSQDLVLLGGLVRLPFGGGFLTPRVDARFFRPDDELGEGFVIGAGGSFEIEVGRGATLVPSLTGRFGSVDIRPDASSDFLGLQAGLTLNFGPRGR